MNLRVKGPDGEALTGRIRRHRGEERPRKRRGTDQGGGKFTRPALAVRRVRRRKANHAARLARKANR